jgi:hypothetical protein
LVRYILSLIDDVVHILTCLEAGSPNLSQETFKSKVYTYSIEAADGSISKIDNSDNTRI